MINLSAKQAAQNLGALQPAQTNKFQRLATQSFASQLATLFGKQNGNSTAVASTAVPSAAGRQTNVSRQVSVAAPVSTSSVPTSALTASLTKTATGFSALAQPDPAPTVANTPAAATATPAAAPTPKDTATTPGSLTDDSYWASQPAAVQQLRNIDDENARAAMASQLASQGYTVDVPVMVWGWDPVKTMQMRQTAGYTWVPSAMQNPVEAAPGLTAPGMTPYDPNNPPPGSISVAV